MIFAPRKGTYNDIFEEVLALTSAEFSMLPSDSVVGLYYTQCQVTYVSEMSRVHKVNNSHQTLKVYLPQT